MKNRAYFLTAIVSAAVLLSACSPNGGTVKVNSVALKTETLRNKISATGVVESTESKNVYSTLTYPVKSINVKVGDTVSAGDVLCVIDSEDLEQQCIRIEKETNEMEQSLAAKTKLFEEHKALLFAHAQEETKVKNSIQEQQERLLKSRERRFRLKTQYEQLIQQLKETEQKHTQYLEEKGQIEQQLSKLMDSLKTVKDAKAEAVGKVAQAEGLIEQLQKQINQHSNRSPD